MKTTEKKATRKATKKEKQAPVAEVPTTKKVFVTGPWRTGSDPESKDYWRIRVGITKEDQTAKYSYKMFGPIDRVMDLAQRIAADQKLELAN